MTGSTAALRFISRRMEAVTRRTCPEIQTLSRVRVVVAAVPFVDLDAASRHAGELLHVGDHGAERVPVVEAGDKSICVLHGRRLKVSTQQSRAYQAAEDQGEEPDL